MSNKTKALKRFVYRFSRIPHSIKCGNHSGFRICDTLFYSFLWEPFRLYESRYEKWYQTKSRSYTEKRGPHDNLPQYVECPICLFLKPKPKNKRECNCCYLLGDHAYKITCVHNGIFMIDGKPEKKSACQVMLAPEFDGLDDEEFGKFHVDIPYTGPENTFQVSTIARCNSEEEAINASKWLSSEYARRCWLEMNPKIRLTFNRE